MALIEITGGLWVNTDLVTHVMDTRRLADVPATARCDDGTLAIHVGPEPPIEVKYRDRLHRQQIISRLKSQR